MLAINNTQGWIVAPTYELTEKVFRELVRYIRFRRLKGYTISDYRKEITTDWNSFCICKSADSDSGLIGEGLDYIIMDEAARVKEMVWLESLRPTLMDRKGWAMFISTPRGKNWFDRMYNRGQDKLDEEVDSWMFTSYENPYLERSEIDSAKENLPMRVFQQEVMAISISDSGGVFRGVRNCIANTYSEPLPEHNYTMGVDLAKYEDFTVICVMDVYNSNVVYFDRFTQIDWNLQKMRITEAANRYNNASICVDSTGVGDPIFEDLSRAGLNVAPYKFTGPSKKTLIDNLSIMIEKQEVHFPDIPELVNELEIYEYITSQAGNLRMNAPIGCHDDCVIGLALACHQLGKGELSVSLWRSG